MTTISPPALFTPDDVLALEEEGLYELIDGKLAEKQMSSLATKTAGLITIALGIHIQPKRLGDVYPEQTFRCFPENPDRIRRPDVSFITAERTSAVSEEDHITIALDIAVEVLSPSDKIYELDQKLADYRSAGVKLVWVVNPNSRTIRAHRPDRSVSELVEEDTLTGESVLPGFSARVADLLPAK